MIIVRREKPEDVLQVREINELAFQAPEEAKIVDTLRQSCPNILSLVAEDGDRIVGHIFFSPVEIESNEKTIEGMGLAPMAVRPDRQQQGIGSQLVKSGIDILREQGCPFVIVLGHPEYYPRFGFELASKHCLSSQWDGIPDEAFMIMIMDHDALKGVSGIAKYRKEFDEAM